MDDGNESQEGQYGSFLEGGMGLEGLSLSITFSSTSIVSSLFGVSVLSLERILSGCLCSLSSSRRPVCQSLDGWIDGWM